MACDPPGDSFRAWVVLFPSPRADDLMGVAPDPELSGARLALWNSVEFWFPLTSNLDEWGGPTRTVAAG
jgi:hypothetical protein